MPEAKPFYAITRSGGLIDSSATACTNQEDVTGKTGVTLGGYVLGSGSPTQEQIRDSRRHAMALQWNLYSISATVEADDDGSVTTAGVVTLPAEKEPNERLCYFNTPSPNFSLGFSNPLPARVDFNAISIDALYENDVFVGYGFDGVGLVTQANTPLTGVQIWLTNAAATSGNYDNAFVQIQDMHFYAQVIAVDIGGDYSLTGSASSLSIEETYDNGSVQYRSTIGLSTTNLFEFYTYPQS